MDRRQFIKTLGAGILAFVAIPSITFGRNKYSRFKPEYSCGNWVRVRSNESFGEATEFIDKHMKSIVPNKYRKDVRIITKPLGWTGTGGDFINYQSGSVGWKYTPDKSISIAEKLDIGWAIKVFG